MYKYSSRNSKIKKGIACLCFCLAVLPVLAQTSVVHAWREGFLHPPNTAKPGVYWYFMDGNLSEEAMTKDLESMQAAGIGHVVFLEVNVGVPRGPVDFLSEKWLTLFAHTVKEAKRLGIEITLGIGPGWTGSGGPWVRPEQSMQHLVASTVEVKGGATVQISLPVPSPRKPFFGEGTLTPYLKEQWNAYYKDVAVLAFPTPEKTATISDIDEKALVYRAPYTSMEGVKPNLNAINPVHFPKEAVIKKEDIVDLTNRLSEDGTLTWDAPEGNWTIMRFVSRNNGAITRPAPVPGLGFEADKMDTTAMRAHLDAYIGKILLRLEKIDPHAEGGLKRLHMDSWEMGAQNWTMHFRTVFKKHRGYDPLPFYPVYAGHIVQDAAISERFLWDLRLTAQELVLENHVNYVKKYGRERGLELSIEPYDMNPTADLELGALADVPMCEFWSKGYGFNSAFSVVEATSIAHVNGSSLVPAEAFTAQNDESWKQYPAVMKNQGDWAFAAGINRFVFHTFQSQYLPDSLRPGMTMGPYGVQWNRNQTWWPMVGAYHTYLSRCQFLLQQGHTVADILYLTPEGAPHVFLPPASAMQGNDTIPDRRGYNFDGCAPSQLAKAMVKNGQIVFPSGASYHILVLPLIETMTPALLDKVSNLIRQGATVIGIPPKRSPSLTGFPTCDVNVRAMAQQVWGALKPPTSIQKKRYGQGTVIWGGELTAHADNEYPLYEQTAALLKEMGVQLDFKTDGPIRYTHRTHPEGDIYFVSNKTNRVVSATGIFRSNHNKPQLWDPITGEIRLLPDYKHVEGCIAVPLTLEAYQSYFVVFTKDQGVAQQATANFDSYEPVLSLDGPWQVAFDTQWGGPADTTFDRLTDWSLVQNEGVKYYSGIATYRKSFDFPNEVKKSNRIFLDLGEVHEMARVKLNGELLGTVWTAPRKVQLPTTILKQKGNVLEIEVANLWPNRLIGDEKYPFDGVKNKQWPEWLSEGLPRTSKRYTFTTYQPYKANHSLFKSGLIGPVVINKAKE